MEYEYGEFALSRLGMFFGWLFLCASADKKPMTHA